jgi:hypothetical protein
LLAQLMPLAPKVMDAGPERFGLGTRDRVGPRGFHPSRTLLDRVARVFGVAEVDLYSADGETGVGVVLTEPTGIVVPGSFESLTDAQQVFCLARQLASVAQKTQVVAALGPSNAELLMAGATAVIGIETAASGFSTEQVWKMARRLAKAIPWLSKGRFEDAARGYAVERPDNLSELLRELDRAALRLAMVLSDDLSCLSLIRQRGPALLGLEQAQLAPLIDDLLLFWISPAAMAIRGQLGLA